jgi:hypothetical protein
MPRFLGRGRRVVQDKATSTRARQGWEPGPLAGNRLSFVLSPQKSHRALTRTSRKAMGPHPPSDLKRCRLLVGTPGRNWLQEKRIPAAPFSRRSARFPECKQACDNGKPAFSQRQVISRRRGYALFRTHDVTLRLARRLRGPGEPPASPPRWPRGLTSS